MKWLRKFILWLTVQSKPKDSCIYCDPNGDFYAVYYSDLRKWKIEDGDYCGLKDKTP